MMYQFHVNGRPVAPIRSAWEDAARDAVSSGYAVWSWFGKSRLKLDEQASIARINPRLGDE